MAECVFCQKTLNEDFGMVTCQECGKIQLVDSQISSDQVVEGEFEKVIENKDSTNQLQEAPLEVDPSLEYENLQEPLNSEPFPFFDNEIQSIKSTDQLDSPTDPIAEIEEYGNSEISSAREGFLQFNLIINGIDLGEHHENIREILSDPKFVLNSQEIINSISNGKLVIQNVSAVKASLIVHRLKGLPFQISWEQHAINRPLS